VPEKLIELFSTGRKEQTAFSYTDTKKTADPFVYCRLGEESGKRIASAIAVVEHLKTNRGPVDYRRLNVSLKDPRL